MIKSESKEGDIIKYEVPLNKGTWGAEYVMSVDIAVQKIEDGVVTLFIAEPTLREGV